MANSRTFKTILLGFGEVLTGIVGILSAAILSRLLPISEYGSYRQVFIIYGTIGPLLCLGLPQALYYFLPRNREQSRSILSSNLAALILLGGLFTLFLWAGGSTLVAKSFNNPQLGSLLCLFAPYTLFALPILAVSPYLVSLDRVQALVPYSVGSRLLMLAGAVLPVLWFRTVETAVIGAVFSTFLASAVGLVLMHRVCRQGEWRPSWAQVKQQVKYSIPLGASGVMGMLSVNFDKLLVSMMSNPAKLAVYANGAMELPMIGVVANSATSVLLPEFSALCQKRDYGKVLQLWHRAMVKCSLILLPVMVFCFAMAPEIIRILFSAKYADSMIPFRIYLLIIPLRITSWSLVPMAAGFNRIVLAVEGVSCFTQVLLGFLLIRIVGANGAAIAAVINTYAAVSLGYLFWIRRYTKISWRHLLPWREISKVLLASLLPGIVFISRSRIITDDYLRVLLLGVFYAGGSVWLFSRFRLIEMNVMFQGVWQWIRSSATR
ncbi:MAG: hypothetical protein A2075_16635 [Geobacteraceae bacterium GWC2_58_44]|nr:MAG: hypothetical protein A2075_16635 [Geobacteraceae bacterium GWC2_58_44]HBG05042.1 hypothetical protein [Geobacter sp.]